MRLQVGPRCRGVSGIVGVLSAALLMSGCSSSSTSDSGSKGSFKIMTWASYTGTPAFPEYLAGVKAAVADVNASGGIEGRKIKLVTCDYAGDPNKQMGCVRQAVSEHVSAVVSGLTYLQTGPVFQALKAAGIPSIGGTGLSTDELSSNLRFGLSGLAGWSYGEAKTLVAAGAKHVAIVSCKDTPGCLTEQKLFTEAVKTLSNGKTTVTRIVNASLTSTDLTSVSADAIRGNVDGIAALLGAPTQTVSLIRGLRQQGFRGPIVTEDVLFTPDIAKALGDLAKGVQVVHLLEPLSNTKNSGVARYIADMKKYQPSAEVNDGGLLQWWGVLVFAEIAKQAKGTDAASMVSAANALKVGSIKTDVAPALPAATTSPLEDLPGLKFDPLILSVSGAGVAQANSTFIDPYKP